MEITELWVRNPKTAMRQVVKTDVLNIAWDFGFLLNSRLDPFKDASLWLRNKNWRTLTVARWGAFEHGPESARIKALYPVWNYGEQTLDELEAYLKYGAEILKPVKPDEAWQKTYKPVEGQEHRVVITQLPNLRRPSTKRLLSLLGELQQENPQCVMHLHGVYSFSWIVGGTFRAADFDPQALARGNRIQLPNGKMIHHDLMHANKDLIAKMGYYIADLETPSDKCTFNIRSFLYGAKHWNDEQAHGESRRRPTLSDEDFADLLNKKTLSIPKRKDIKDGHRPVVPLEGDKFYCDSCSYSSTCRLFRTGSICAVPDSESADLARHFKTRNSEMIIAGLGKIMEGEIERYVDGKNLEAINGELDPHVTRIAGALFKQGEQLARLVDPSLRTSAVAVNIAANQASVGVGGGRQETTQQLASRMIGELEKGGVPRDKISEDMVRKAMSSYNLEEFIAAEAMKSALPQVIEAEEAEEE